MQFTKNSVFRSMLLAITTAGFLLPAAFAEETVATNNARYAVGPDSNLDLLLHTLDSAKKKLQINIYQFENLDIVDHLIQRIEDGVTVEMLLETEPCCTRRMAENGKLVLRKVFAAMKASGNKDHKLYLMGSKLVSPSTAVKRRFTYDHAKYLIADDKLVHMSSENFTDTGHPLSGLVGNRGWDIAIENKGMAQTLINLFREDTDLSFQDVLLVEPSKDSLPAWVSYEAPKTSENLLTTESSPTRRRNRKVNYGAGKVSDVKLIISPDSLDGIETFMDQAKNTLNIQFMSLPPSWGRASTQYVNPIVDKAIEAAARGVKVRVLLNDERVFVDTDTDPSKPRNNEITAAFLDRISQCKRLDIKSKIIDIDASGIRYIHNKGIIVDQDQVLVSSINGTQNSVLNNRETALAITSPDTNTYFTKLFDFDWNQTTQTYSDAKTKAAKSQLIGCPTLPFEQSTNPTSLSQSGMAFFF